MLHSFTLTDYSIVIILLRPYFPPLSKFYQCIGIHSLNMNTHVIFPAGPMATHLAMKTGDPASPVTVDWKCVLILWPQEMQEVIIRKMLII